MTKELEQYVDEFAEKVYQAGQESMCSWEKVLEAGIERGRNEAWECARKIFLPTDKGGLDISVLRKIFDDEPFVHNMLKNYSASEAIAKIKEYEEQNAVTRASIIKTHLDDIIESGFTTDEIAEVLKQMQEKEE